MRDRGEWYGVWKAQMREAIGEIWRGDVQNGIQLLEKVRQEMKAYHAGQRGGIE